MLYLYLFESKSTKHYDICLDLLGSSDLNLPAPVGRMINNGLFSSMIASSPSSFLMRTLCLDNLRIIDLVKEIIKIHRDDWVAKANFDVQIYVNHTQYLTQHQYLMKSEKMTLWCVLQIVDHHNLIKFNKEVMMNWTFSENNHITVCILSETCSSDSRFLFLTHQYLIMQQDLLQSYTDVQTIIFFAQMTTKSYHTTYHYVMKIISSFYIDILSPKWLENNLLLYYLVDKKIDYSSNSGRDILFETLWKLEFLHENGFFSVISSCYLRIIHLEKFLIDDMNILHIESPQDQKWFFLKHLGAISEPNLELFLHQLQG